MRPGHGLGGRPGKAGPTRQRAQRSACAGTRDAWSRSLHRDDHREIVQSGEIARVSGVEREPVRDRNGGDHQVGDPAAGLAPSGEYCGGDQPEGPRCFGVGRQGLERGLNVLEDTHALRARPRRRRGVAHRAALTEAPTTVFLGHEVGENPPILMAEVVSDSSGTIDPALRTPCR